MSGFSIHSRQARFPPDGADCVRKVLSLPKTPSELRMLVSRAFVRSCCDHDDFFFVAFISLVASSFRTRAASQSEILALL